MIEIKNVSKRFARGKTLFRELQLTIGTGEFAVITGPSGAGKTSLLQMLYGFLRPTEGQVAIERRDLYSLSAEERAIMRRRMGFVFQDFRLIPHFTVAENVGLPLVLQNIPQSRIDVEVEKTLKRIGIFDLADEFPTALSGGAQQKVAVARAIVHQPQWLFADEPTGNLDPGATQDMIKLFREIHQSGTSIVLATHDEDIVRQRPGVCIRLEHGTIRGHFNA